MRCHVHQAKVLSKCTTLDWSPSLIDYVSKVMNLSHIFGDLSFVDYFTIPPFIFLVSYEWLLYTVLVISPSTKGIRVELRSKSVY